MSATKAERIKSTKEEAALMVLAANLNVLVKRRLRTPWNNNAHKFVPLTRLPLHWNWSKFEYILS